MDSINKVLTAVQNMIHVMDNNMDNNGIESNLISILMTIIINNTKNWMICMFRKAMTHLTGDWIQFEDSSQ